MFRPEIVPARDPKIFHALDKDHGWELFRQHLLTPVERSIINHDDFGFDTSTVLPERTHTAPNMRLGVPIQNDDG
jgi:hypothetical protein